ncbi:MAG TPA: hypothetical protein VL524_15545 [Gemmatimonadaceae bacterium]|jgi:hypothetical protein|nr:hypothetical protein [Gemmatimonadaceae bacterium]
MRPSWCERAVAALIILSGPARAAAAQSVMLQIKPQVGDTIRMRLDQQSEMTGVRRTESGEASAMVLTTMTMFSRAIVEGMAGEGIAVLAVTDSVRLSTTDDRTRVATQQMQSQMRGQQTRFRVLPDGSVSMLQADGGGAPREVAQVVSLMPATFPKTPIAVGQTWSREMSLPVGTQLGAQVSARLQVKFRLDSLTRNGKVACVSMRGDLRPASGPGAASGAVLEKGLVSGTMLLDQQRGWLKESWFNIVVSSSLKPAPATNAQPIRMQMRITQHMHTVERR